MGTKKLSITLPTELAEMIRREAQAQGTSVSAVIADALGVLVRREAAQAATSAFEREEGSLTPAEIADAEAVWGRIEAHGRDQNRAGS